MATREQTRFLRDLENNDARLVRMRIVGGGGLAVQISLAAGQSNPTNASPINFTVTFSEAVTGFTNADISFTGSTVGGTLAAAVTGGPTTYNVAVTGMTGSGIVLITIAARIAATASGALIPASATTGIAVIYDTVAPTVTINQAAGQNDPTSTSPINFTVTFSEIVNGFISSDVVFTGSTVGGTLVATVTGSGALYNVAVSGMTTAGNVVVSVPANAAFDRAGNLSGASTSTDNIVAWAAVATYIGPGDLAAFTAWWGNRAYSAASIGNSVVTLRRVSDDATQIFVAGANGKLDQTAINTFKGASTLKVAQYFDQTGNGFHVLPVDTAHEMPWTLGIQNGMGVYDNTAGAGTKYFAPITSTQADLNSHGFYGVYKVTSTHFFQLICGLAIDEIAMIANRDVISDEVVVKNEGKGAGDDEVHVTALDGQWHAAAGNCDQRLGHNGGGLSFVTADNVSTDTHDIAGNPVSTAPYQICVWGGDGNGPNTNPLIGYGAEVGWISTPLPGAPLSQAQAAALISNARAFWNLP